MSEFIRAKWHYREICELKLHGVKMTKWECGDRVEISIDIERLQYGMHWFKHTPKYAWNSPHELCGMVGKQPKQIACHTHSGRICWYIVHMNASHPLNLEAFSVTRTSIKMEDGNKHCFLKILHKLDFSRLCPPHWKVLPLFYWL